MVAVAIGCGFGCTTRSVPPPPLVCGGSVTAEQVADWSRAAGTTEYLWARSWAQQHCATSPVPESRRVFVIRETRPRLAFVFAHRNGYTLGDVLRQTSLRAGNVKVLRESEVPAAEHLETDDSTYEIRPLDVVIISRTPK